MLKYHPPYFNPDDDSVNKYVKNPQSIPMYKILSENFRYLNDEMKIDTIKEYQNKKYKYLKGVDIYLQAWSPRSSTETRLIIKDIPPSIEYKHNEWDNKFTFLKNLRMYGYFNYFYDIVKNYESKNVINDYDASFDSMLEIYIILNYIYKTKMNYTKFDKKIDLDRLFELKYKIDEHLNYTITDRCNNNIKCIPTKINMYYKMGKTYKVSDTNDIIVDVNKINNNYKLMEC